MKIIFRFIAFAMFLASSNISSAFAKTDLKDALNITYQAPEIIGIEKWFNGNAQKISNLKGKVVLIDFWTYSCINCLRTLPHIKELHEKYGDKGLVIIGIHAPEFEFEKNPQNVENAVKRFGIKYLVALDNSLSTWKNFDNHYWPAHYLINQQGKVVYEHFGEGKYDVMENNIAALLALDNMTIKKDKNNSKIFAKKFTPETYLGLERGSNNFNKSEKNLTFPKTLPVDGWALEGDWKLDRQFIEAKKSGASLRLNFISKKVFLVMASASKKEVSAKISVNGKEANLGLDVKNGEVKVKESRLYELVNLPKHATATLEITAKDAGLQAYAFTFGE
ncbi:MAG: thioredoxin family protein [Rickettsiales bacterium]|nr:thioredoxin family protein [Rickettsiales bacterium]